MPKIDALRGRAVALALLLTGCGAPSSPLGPASSPPFGLLSTSALPASLRIGLDVDQATIRLDLLSPATCAGQALPSGSGYTLTSSGDRVELRLGTRTLTWANEPLEIQPRIDGTLGYAGRRYRGTFEGMSAPGDPGHVTLVDVVPMEAYLRGVVPVEMKTGWPAQALAAQAVAARTYAAANVGRRADLGFDLYADTRDQVYDGASVEAPDTDSAVRSTRGMVLTYQGAPIDALFHAASGGETDDAIAVWGLDLPYIRGIRDTDPSPYAHWTRTLTASEVERGLAACQVDVASVQGLDVEQWTPHGRARWLSVAGTQGNAIADANTFRLATRLPSTRFVLSATQAGWEFRGEGLGHGLGMSQWGAEAYAQLGWSFSRILTRYYTGVALSQP